MGKTQEGTRDIKRGEVVKSQSGDPRQIRCQRCRTSLCVATPDGKGGTMQKCTNTSCGATFTSRRI